MKLTVFYDGQFWVGVLEEVLDGRLRAVRYVFGPEPYDWEIMQFVKYRMLQMIARSVWEVDVKLPKEIVNPKRKAREAAKETKRCGVSTYAQEAVQRDHEARKQEGKIAGRHRKKEKEERNWLLRQEKIKMKKKGR